MRTETTATLGIATENAYAVAAISAAAATSVVAAAATVDAAAVAATVDAAVAAANFLKVSSTCKITDAASTEAEISAAAETS